MKMINRYSAKPAVAFIVLALLASASLFAQDISYPSVRVNISPTVAFPLGEDVDYFGPGIGGTADAAFAMPFLPALALGPEAGYSINLLGGDHGDQLSTIRGGAFVRFSPFLAPRILLTAQGGGGFYYTFLNREAEQSGYNPYAGGSLGLALVLGEKKGLALGVSGLFRSYLGFFSEAGVTLSASLNMGKRISPASKKETFVIQELRPPLRPLRFSDFSADPIFPTLSKYYDKNSFGTVNLTNPNDESVHDIQILFYINNYMDTPKECVRIAEIGPGETRTIELYGLFNTSILDIYEKSKVTALVQAKYSGTTGNVVEEQPFTVEILDRNALIWDDDRRAAAFVTAKDPVVMKFAKNIVSLVDAKSGINENLYKGMAVFSALKEHGITYNIDPASPYAELSGSSHAVDYLQYPRQTLDYKSGDCDDLTVMFSALLESIGVKTAFITIPGHIYIGFSLGLPFGEASKVFVNPEDLIDHNGEAWLPLEITQVKANFITAWTSGAGQWRTAFRNGEAGFFIVQEAWKTYDSVAFFEDTMVRFPEEEKLRNTFASEVERFVGIQLAPQTAALEARLQTDGSPYRIKNRLGVLFAKFGQFERAERELSAALTLSPEYKPALVNLGNLKFLHGEYEAALVHFSKAENTDGRDADVLISLALVYRELGKYDETLIYYNRVKDIKPALAERYNHLAPGGGGAARASDRRISKEDLLWQE